jgi:8-oxo-dGTP diphosphatase
VPNAGSSASDETRCSTPRDPPFPGARFDPRGALSDDDLAAEHISEMRWWRHGDIAGYGGPDLFSPRDIATPLAALIAGDIPGTPVQLGL